MKYGGPGEFSDPAKSRGESCPSDIDPNIASAAQVIRAMGDGYSFGTVSFDEICRGTKKTDRRDLNAYLFLPAWTRREDLQEPRIGYLVFQRITNSPALLVTVQVTGPFEREGMLNDREVPTAEMHVKEVLADIAETMEPETFCGYEACY